MPAGCQPAEPSNSIERASTWPAPFYPLSFSPGGNREPGRACLFVCGSALCFEPTCRPADHGHACQLDGIRLHFSHPAAHRCSSSQASRDAIDCQAMLDYLFLFLILILIEYIFDKAICSERDGARRQKWSSCGESGSPFVLCQK